MNTSTLPPLLGDLGVLSDATRFRILMALEEREFGASEIARILQLPQPTVSRHLRHLAEAGWVRARSDGARRPYRLPGDLDEGRRTLWVTLREATRGDSRIAEDRERATAVLAQRESRSREFFASTAERWDARRAELYGTHADLLPLFGLLEPGWAVVDLGGGTGGLAGALAPFVRRIVVVDRSPEMLAAARARLRDVAHAEFVESEAEALPLEACTIDLVVVSLVLHHLADPLPVLAEARRILRPGGRLVVVDMREHDRADLTHEMGHQWPGFTPERLEAWLQAAGLAPRRAVPLPPDPDAQGPLLLVQTAVRPKEQAPEPDISQESP